MEQRSEVTIIDIRMPFWSMVKFTVKWSLASIPAAIILIFIVGCISAVIMFGMELLGLM